MLCTLLVSGGRGVLRAAGSARVNFVLRRNIGLDISDDSLHAGTMAEVKEVIRMRLGLEHGYNPIPPSREHLLKYQPKLKDLAPRTMQHSYTSATIPLSSNKELQDKYVALLGNVRMGRLLEDMDIFAVWVCHQHVQVPNLPKDVPLPYTFVTILVDKVHFTDLRPEATKDIRLSGHVSWVGNTSMEIVVWLEQENNGVYKKITKAYFLMVARNATNSGAAPVNPLKPANEKEQKVFDAGVKRKEKRQILQASSIFKVEPNNYEQSLMYDLFQRTTPTHTMELNKRVLPDNCRWMSESFSVNTVAAFPENRNAQNTVFGGFLMRQAVEISWVGASIFSKSRATLKHVCDISFQKPVSVSSFIKMTAYVVYTEANYIQMMTIADILNFNLGEQMTSNVFYCTFQAREQVPQVVPRSYHEAVWYIQGRRKFHIAFDLK